MSAALQNSFDWREERLRYQVLRFAYDRVGRECDAVITGTEIGTALALGVDEVLRVTTWLDGHGYVHDLGGGARFCLAPRGIEYLESAARRRNSLRE